MTIKVKDYGDPEKRKVAEEGREALEAEVGQVWNTEELTTEFEVTGFSAPYVIVKRKADGVTGSLEFTHHPRFYFHFVSNQEAE
jgi:hypothetical protein